MKNKQVQIGGSSVNGGGIGKIFADKPQEPIKDPKNTLKYAGLIPYVNMSAQAECNKNRLQVLVYLQANAPLQIKSAGGCGVIR